MREATQGGGARPLIGVTTYFEAARWGVWVREAALVPASYLRSVERAGGVPVLLPPGSGGSGSAAAIIRGLDGVIFAGGADVDPQLYGAERHEQTAEPQPLRDRSELTLLRSVIDADVPFLAICRGMQLLNVGRGGTLIQHLPEVLGNTSHAPGSGKMGKHAVQISISSAVGKILGDSAVVPSYHHQAVNRLGTGLVAVAWSDDQVVEAVELQGHRFGLGVQWHPEEGDDPRLFEALVSEAASR